MRDGNMKQHASGQAFQIPDSATSYCKLATGRSALLHLIHRLPQPHESTVLLPSYIAEGVLRPCLVAGFKIMYYRLEHDLSPSVTDVGLLLSRIQGSAVVVIVHYFGFWLQKPELSAVLRKAKAIVISDCAHAPFTKVESDDQYDAHAELSLYSLNKLIPVIDGALLVSERADIDLSIDVCELPELPVEAQEAYLHHLCAAEELLGCKDHQQSLLIFKRLGMAYERYYALINNNIELCRQSMFSREVESNTSYDWMINRRLENSRLVYDGLDTAACIPVFPTLHSGIVPWCIPARVSANGREKMLDSLFHEGILLSTLIDKWDFVPDSGSDRYREEREFIDQHVLIPVSEFISAESITRMVEIINREAPQCPVI
jgi:dTDP-4-amino-4,6-dideoxygalactose transaminase